MRTTLDKLDYLLMVPSCCGGPVGRSAMLAFRATPIRPQPTPERKDDATDRTPKPTGKPRVDARN